jgi:hypothetical protein
MRLRQPLFWLLPYLVACAAADRESDERDAAAQAADASPLADTSTQDEPALDAATSQGDGRSDAAPALSDASAPRDASVDAAAQVIIQRECVDSDSPNNPSTAGVVLDALGVKGRATGAGEMIEDRCDAMGNLLEAECAKQLGCSKPGPCAPTWMNTGFVTSSQHDCLGMCADGVCSLPCPKSGEALTLRAGDSPDRVLLIGTAVRLLCTRLGACSTAGALGSRQMLTSVSPQPACSDPMAWQFSTLMLSDGCAYASCLIERLSP